MKILSTQGLRNRLKNAAFNGSIIAKDILAQLNSNKNVKEVIKGNYNFFNTKLIKKIINIELGLYTQKVHIACCNKDINNEFFPDYGNPDAIYKIRNQNSIDLSTFKDLFKLLPNYTSDEISYFNHVMSLNEKIVCRILSGVSGFSTAYYEGNYTQLVQEGESPLHHSCMRYANVCDICASFYANVCKAKIIVAQGVTSGEIYGRAIVWDNVELANSPVKFSLLDRIYYSNYAIMTLIKNFASRHVNLFRLHNDCGSYNEFFNLNSPHFEIGPIHLDRIKFKIDNNPKWYKCGVPYADTFIQLNIDFSNNQMFLENYPDDLEYNIAKLRNSNGVIGYENNICACCNKLISLNKTLCKKCTTRNKDRYSEYKGQTVPKVCLNNGRPTEQLKNYLLYEKFRRI